MNEVFKNKFWPDGLLHPRIMCLREQKAVALFALPVAFECTFSRGNKKGAVKKIDSLEIAASVK